MYILYHDIFQNNFFLFLNTDLKKVSTTLERYVIINPIVESVVGQNYIDIKLANSGSASAPIVMIMDVLSDSYYVKGVKLIDSTTYTWRIFFNTEFTTLVSFRLAIHYKRTS